MESRLRFLLLAALFAVLLPGCEKKESVPEAELTGQGTAKIQEALYREAEVTQDLGAYEIAYFSKTVGGSGSEKGDAEILETSEPLRIVDYGPDEVLPSEVMYPEVYILFSQPIIPLTKLGEPMIESSVISIDPPISGVFRWRGSRLLVFQAEEKIISQRGYQVTVSDNVKSLGGKTLENPLSFEFRTEYLDLISFFAGKPNSGYSQNNVPMEDAKEIHCTFNYPVDPHVIGDYFRITGKTGSGEPVEYPYILERPEDPGNRLSKEELQAMVVILIQEKIPEATDITMTINRGAKSFTDALPIPEEITRTFSTLQPFGYESHDTYSWAFPGREAGNHLPLYLNFSHPIDSQSVTEDAFIVEPGLVLKQENIEIQGNTVALFDVPFQFESTYTLTIKGNITDIYGRSLGREERTRITFPAAERYSYFPNTGHRMLEAGFPPKIIWEYQNVFDGVWKADKIDNPYQFFTASRLAPYDFTGTPRNKPVLKVFDFSAWLNSQGFGWVGFSWNFGERNSRGERSAWQQSNLTLQVTDLGLTLRYAYNRLIAMVTSLSSGQPVEGARVLLLRETEEMKSGETDKNGVAAFSFSPGEYRRLFGDSSYSWKDHLRLEAAKGSDRIQFVPNDSHNNWKFGIYNTISPLSADRGRMETYLFTDRGLYKPGETLSYMGIDADLVPDGINRRQGGYTITAGADRYDSEPFFTANGTTLANGGFSGSIVLPENLEPGYYFLRYGRTGSDGGESSEIGFRVAYFQRAGFSLSIQGVEDIYYSGDTLSWEISADYLSGGTVTSGTWDYYWIREPASFRPGEGNWENYSFCPESMGSRESLNQKSGRLDDSGIVEARQKTGGEEIKGMPYAYSVEAGINDPANQEIAGRKGVLVHPSDIYIGAKFGKPSEESSYFLNRGEMREVSIVLVDPRGGLIKKEKLPKVLRAELYHVQWKRAQQQGIGGDMYTQYERIEELEDRWDVPVKNDTISTEITPKEAGFYFLRLILPSKESESTESIRAVTDLSFYSTGAGWAHWGMDYGDEIGLESDKSVYTPGESAEILCKSPIPRGRYLVTVEREGILDEWVEVLDGSARTITIPIKDSYTPRIFVSLASYSVRTGEPVHSYYEPDLDKPQGLFGIIPLEIDTAGREISCGIKTDKGSYQPGDEVEVELTTDIGGEPLTEGDISFLAVDRGVLDLIDYHVPNPLSFFYDQSRYPLGARGADSRSLLIDPVTYEVKQLQGGGGDGKLGEEGAPESVSGQDRRDFNPTAAFTPFLKTDARGKATYRFRLPDNLTTYRMTLLAAKGDKFGMIEKELVVRNPVNVKPSFPSVLRLRDTAVGTVLLTNLTDKPVDTEIGITSELLKISGEERKEVSLPGGSTIAVPFKILALEAGKGSITIAADSKIHSEKVTLTIRVDEPVVTEGFTTTGETEKTTEEGVVIPSTLADSLGFLELTLSGTRVGEAKDAMEYLLSYPFNCLEQQTARLFPLLAFHGQGDAFYGISGEERKKRVEDFLLLLSSVQNEDGGFPFWPERGRMSSYFISSRVVHTLALASRGGYVLPEDIDVQGLLAYLGHPPETVRRDPYLTSYSLYARSLWGEPVMGDILQASAMGDALGISGFALLGLALHNSGDSRRAEVQLARIKKFIKPGTQTVELVETREAGTLYDSSIERLSLALLLYERLKPEDEMITRLSRTLSLKIHGGRPLTTSSAAWAVLSIAGLPEITGGEEPRFYGTVRIDDNEMVQGEINGPGEEPIRKRIRFDEEPILSLKRDVLHPLRFSKEGSGRLYYTASLKYALPAELVEPRDEGISVHTEIEDSRGRPVSELVLSPGKTYKMRVTISSPRERDFLALRVPVASGAEIVDTSFITTKRYSQEEGESPNAPPGEKRIMEREVQYVWNSFPAGKEEVSFLFRTVHAGVYPVPPASAECMYEPEVFGRGRGEIIIITTASHEN